MKLKPYLDQHGIAPATFAASAGVTPQAIYRYMSGQRTPCIKAMRRIEALTGGHVQPNDWISTVQADPVPQRQEAA